MKRSRSAFGVSMLDLITNALAAAFILFMVFSYMQSQPIPPERVLGTLTVRITFEYSPEIAEFALWVKSPYSSDGKRKFNKEILDLNYDELAFGKSILEYIGNLKLSEAALQPSYISVYTPPDSQNIRTIVVRDPHEGEWEVGVLYVAHENLEQKEQPAYATIQAWFLEKRGKRSPVSKSDEKAKLLKAPTQFHLKAKIDIRDPLH